jgi:hypothetical protein
MHNKYIITYECHDNAPRMWKVVKLEKYFDFSLYYHHFSLLSLTSLLSAPEREVASPSDFKVVGALQNPCATHNPILNFYMLTFVFWIFVYTGTTETITTHTFRIVVYLWILYKSCSLNLQRHGLGQSWLNWQPEIQFKN